MSKIVKNPLIIETQYLPSISWLLIVNKYDVIYLDSQEHYVKASYRNRCHVLSPNGLLKLTIPLLHGKQQRNKTGEVKIANEISWQKIHWMTLMSCYRSSPYFEFYEDMFYPLYNIHFEKLFDFNLELIKLLFKILKLEKDFRSTENYIEKENENFDVFRNKISAKEINPLNLSLPIYNQVFSDRFSFMENLSVIDWLFNIGKIDLSKY